MASARWRLEQTQSLLFEMPRPEIEFYDEDPWQIDNLAPIPEFQPLIVEHFTMLQAWRASTGDFPPWQRRRADYADRVTGVLYSLELPPMRDE